MTSLKTFRFRLFVGWLHIVVYIIGNTLIPITINQTLANTAPFWAAIFAHFLVNEGIRKIEIVAMIISFGAVCLITWSSSSGDEKGEKERMFF